MASTCRKHMKSVILPVPLDVFVEFLNISLCSDYTMYALDMKRETLCIFIIRKEYEHQVWEEMCVLQRQTWFRCGSPPF